MTTGVELTGLQIGIAMGAASMASIGPNNLMLLREGLVRGRSGLMAGIVWSSYGVLISLALMMAGTSLAIDPKWQTTLCWAGLAALSWFALQSFRTALHRATTTQDAHLCEGVQACIARVLKVVWCNPLTYVELLLIPSALAQTMADVGDRIAFAASLLVTSAVCVLGYAYGGEALARVVRNRQSLRLFDVTSGLILTVVAAGLAVRLMSEGL